MRRKRWRCDRRIIERHDRDRDRRSRETALAVADLIGDRIGAVEIERRRIRDRAVGIDHNRAIRRACRDHGQRIAINIGIIAQNSDCYRRVFIGRCSIVGRNRGIVDRIDRDCNRRGRCAALAVADRIRDRISAVEIGARCIDNRPVGIDDNRAIRCTCRRNGQRIAIGIAVIGQNRNRDGRILIGPRNIVDRNRRVIDCTDGDDHGSGRKTAIAVADRVNDRIDAIEIGIGHIAQRAVGIDRDGAVARCCERHDQRITIRIGIIRQHRYNDRRVFTGRRGIVHRCRCRVGDRPCERLTGRKTTWIGTRNRHGINATARLAGIFVNRARDRAGCRVDAQAGRQTTGGKAQRVAIAVAEIAADIDRNRLIVLIGFAGQHH